MKNALFNRETLKGVGFNRPASLFEVSIDNVDTSDLSKFQDVSHTREKFEEGMKVFLLDQPPIIHRKGIKYTVESTDKSDNPVMVEQTYKEPLLDEKGNVRKMEMTSYGEVTEETDEPVMITNDEGEEVQKTDKDGNKLYYGYIKTGIFVEMYETKIETVHKTDEYGRKLYLHEKTRIEDEIEEVPPLKYVEGTKEYEELSDEVKEKLYPETFEELVPTEFFFSSSPERFTFEDVRKHKQKQVVKGTFYSKAVLLESMNETLFSTGLSSFHANLGFGFISLPPGGEVRTEKIKLPETTDLVGIKIESENKGDLKVYVGSSASTMQELSAMDDVSFDSNVSDVYVKVENQSENVVDFTSLAILV
jgi:hypothetical protein